MPQMQDKWWANAWAEQKAKCEANWQKYGIYGNCWDSSTNGPSKYFGYVKNEDGTFTPYRFLHPGTLFDRFDALEHFELNRISKLLISEEEKFKTLKESLVNFEPDNQEIDYYRNNKIKQIEEYLSLENI